MIRSTLALTSIFLLAYFVQADEPTGIQIQQLNLLKIGKTDRKSETIEVSATVCVPELRTVVVKTKVLVNGVEKEVDQQRAITVYKYIPVTKQISLKGATAFTGDGKKLAGDQLWDTLKEGKVVLSGNGDSLDPQWLKLLQADAIVLLVKPEAIPEPKALHAPKQE